MDARHTPTAPPPHHPHTTPGLPPPPQEDRMGCEAAPDEDAEVEPGAVPPGWPAPCSHGAPTSGPPVGLPGSTGATWWRRGSTPALSQPRLAALSTHALPAAPRVWLRCAGRDSAKLMIRCPRNSLSFLPSFLRGWRRARKPLRCCAGAAAGLLAGIEAASSFAENTCFSTLPIPFSVPACKRQTIPEPRSG